MIRRCLQLRFDSETGKSLASISGYSHHLPQHVRFHFLIFYRYLLYLGLCIRPVILNISRAFDIHSTDDQAGLDNSPSSQFNTTTTIL